MKKRFTISMIVILAVVHTALSQDKQVRKDIYDALSSNDITQIDAQLNVLKQHSEVKGKAAYEGTLLMRKAGLISGAGKKLKMFKDGREKLEAAIVTDKDNGEYRFLRLMIQENAPGILHYNSNIDEDLQEIHKQYNNIPAEAQNAITAYSKLSKILQQHPVAGS